MICNRCRGIGPVFDRLSGESLRQRRSTMAGQEDLDQVREKTDEAKDYFSKIPGFQAPNVEKPAPVEEEKPASEDWVAPAKSRPEAPLSEAEKYFKGII